MKNILYFQKIIQTCHLLCDDQDATIAPARHRKQRVSLNWAQFMLQWFITCPEFAEFTEFTINLGKTPIFTLFTDMDLIYKKPRFELEEKLIDSIIRLTYLTCFVCKRVKLGSLESVIHFHSEYVHFLLVRFRFYVVVCLWSCHSLSQFSVPLTLLQTRILPCTLFAWVVQTMHRQMSNCPKQFKLLNT